MLSVRVAIFVVLQGVVLALDPTSCTANKITSNSACTDAVWTCACMSSNAVCGSIGTVVNDIDCSTGTPGFSCGSGYTPVCNCIGTGCTVQVDSRGTGFPSASCTLQSNALTIMSPTGVVAPNGAVGSQMNGNTYGLAAFTWSTAQDSSSTNPWTTSFTITQPGGTSTLSIIKMETGTQKCTQSRLIIMPSGAYSMVRYLTTCGLSSGNCTGRLNVNMVAYFAVNPSSVYNEFAGCTSCPAASIYTDGNYAYCSTSCGALNHFYLSSSSTPIFTDMDTRPFNYQIQQNNIAQYPISLITDCRGSGQVGQNYCACIDLSNRCAVATGTTPAGFICPSPYASVCYSNPITVAPPATGSKRDISGTWTRIVDTCSESDCLRCRSTLSTTQSDQSFVALPNGESCTAVCQLRIAGTINNDQITAADGTPTSYVGTADSSTISFNVVQSGRSACTMKFSYSKSTSGSQSQCTAMYAVAVSLTALVRILL